MTSSRLLQSMMALGILIGSFGALGLLAHDDDPKLNSPQPPYLGPGFRRDLAGPLASGPFLSDGVTLESWLPISEFAGSHDNASDCWGYVSASGREYALLALYAGTGFVEITDPGNAQVITTIAGPGSLWRDVKVYQDFAYVVTENSSGGIQVIDMSDIDNGQVTLTTTITSGGNLDSHNVAIDTTSGFLYRCGGSSSDGLRIYSLANPANPTFVGSWNDRYCHDAQVYTYSTGPWAGRQIAFVCGGFNGGWVDTGLDILDVTNKSNIVSLGQIIYANGEYSHQAWLSEDGQYLYLNDELDEANLNLDTTTFVIDVSDLMNPFLANTFTNGNTAIGHNLYVKGNLIFEANYRSGLRIFDMSNDPTSPSEVAWFDTYPDDDDKNYNGLWSTYPYFPSGTVLGSDREKGLFVLSLDDPPCPDPWVRGEVNGDGNVDVGDAIYLLSYLFDNGPAPDPFEAADTNGDIAVNVADAVYLLEYLFNFGPPPPAPFPDPGCP